VTQNDLGSVKDVPIEEALAYLGVLERERRGLLKVGTILRAAQQARLTQEAAELRLTKAEQRAVDAQVTLDAIEVSISGGARPPTTLDETNAPTAWRRSGAISKSVETSDAEVAERIGSP
jgi:hypothetical protein